MKVILVILAAVLVAGGTKCLIPWSEGPADEGEIKRAHADRIMCETYGPNWQERFKASIRNHAPNKAMVKTYETAIGYHRAK